MSYFIDYLIFEIGAEISIWNDTIYTCTSEL